MKIVTSMHKNKNFVNYYFCNFLAYQFGQLVYTICTYIDYKTL